MFENERNQYKENINITKTIESDSKVEHQKLSTSGMPPKRARATNSISADSTPRRTSSRRAGSTEPHHEPEPVVEPPLDIKDPEDAEYQEEQKEGEDDEDEDDAYSGDDDDDEEDEEVVKPKRRKLQRSSSSRSKRSTNEDEEEEEEEEDDGALDLEEGDPQEDGEQQPEEEEEEEEQEAQKKSKPSSGTSTPVRVGRRGPGRGKKGPMQLTPAPPPVDERPLEMKDDEYILTDDEEGDTKISEQGELQGGRQFRVRTFTVKGKGDRLYMLSTEPARCMGFRDSYLLFQKHRRLYKVVLSSEEKFNLINRDIIPHSYKGRVIGLVTAKSIFKEFGAKIIVGGRNITDDYYAKRLREKGEVVEGELAEPEDSVPPKGTPYNQNQFVAWHGASSVYHSGGVSVVQPQAESLELKSMKALKSTNHINEENWMYQHAAAVRQFESTLLHGRQTLAKGLRDPYTGVLFVPGLTQPNNVGFNKLIDPKTEHNGEKKKLIYDTVVKSENLAKRTGLKNVPLEIFDGLVSEEIKQAILRQQQYESASV